MKHLYPIITTAMVRECREFYVHALGATVLFEQDWYVHLSIDGWEIGFIAPNPRVRLPVFRHATQSRGLCIALEVPDVRGMHRELQEKHIDIFGPLEQLAGGELAFSVMDPSGAVLNVVQRTDDVLQISPALL